MADDGGLQKLAFELSLRLLDQQEATLNELRARTGTLLAGSSLIASFLGARALDRAGFGIVTGAAIVAFIFSIATSAYVLLPKQNLIFGVRGSELFEEEFGEPGGLSETHRRLAYWLESFRDDNQPTVDRLFFWFRMSVGALLFEAILWMLDLGLG